MQFNISQSKEEKIVSRLEIGAAQNYFPPGTFHFKLRLKLGRNEVVPHHVDNFHHFDNCKALQLSLKTILETYGI